ncbi:Rpn family recombination-promoting nuclease/putative transposase [Halomonas sp. EF61]|uniref:Rpn family recombination-promoting nuclease/putative transposase n=1 Tax=Halomonas sp. EF61 TaxID=2950869 RepID=UPI0032DE741F
MKNQHDQSYKLLFSEPRVIRDLLTGFIGEDWIEKLDLDSLERVSGSFVTDDLRDRENDVIWRARFGDEWCYVYLLLEFQSTVDRFMALRTMTYVGLLYQDLVKQKQLTRSGKLPPVLPIVLYNGERRWSAPVNVRDLIQAGPGSLAHYRPDLSFLLLDEGALVADQQFSSEARNVVSAIFQLEHHRSPADAVELIGLLVKWLQTPEQTDLRRHFVIWIKRVLLPNWVSNEEQGGWQALNELSEVHNMLAERAKRWPEQWKQQGLAEGRREGREEGREEGRQEGRKEGRKEGRQEVKQDVARNMIQQTSLDDQTIAQVAEISIELVSELRQEIERSN